ncbi:ATP synthase subunit delta [Aristophania vespae]|nr:ATP synthase subunit delta [Aristophania vespae]
MTVAQQKRNKAPSEVAQRYARAFYEIITAGADASAVLERIDLLVKAFDDNADLQVLLSDPRFDTRNASELASNLCKALNLGDDIRRLIGTVIQNGRFSKLVEILQAILLLDAQARREVSVEVSTAQSLTDEQRNRLIATLKEAGYDNTAITERHDPSLLGGMVVRVGSVLFDTSIAGRLARLQHAMKGAA